MIKTIIFDLDGTLIHTEVLKAKSYALAINTLTKGEVPEKNVIDRFKKYVGLSRLEVVAGLVEDFNQELNKYYSKDSNESIGEWMISKRLSIYHDMVNDQELLSNHVCSFNLGLLKAVAKDKYKVVLATMSHLKEAEKVLKVLGIKDKLDLILTRDNVSEGKPNPEIYHLAMKKMNVKADECIVLEDSVNGIGAGVNAGMYVFAVTNNITHESVINSGLLSEEFIIEHPAELQDRVYNFIDTRRD